MSIILFPSGEANEEGLMSVAIHYFPEMLTEEEKVGGILIESMPEPPSCAEGCFTVPLYSPKANLITYSIRKMALTKEQKVASLERKIQEQEETIKQLTETITGYSSQKVTPNEKKVR